MCGVFLCVFFFVCFISWGGDCHFYMLILCGFVTFQYGISGSGEALDSIDF